MLYIVYGLKDCRTHKEKVIEKIVAYNREECALVAKSMGILPKRIVRAAHDKTKR